MSLMPGHFFKPLQQRVVDPSRTELDDKLIVVDRGLFSILHRAPHVPRCDDLVVSSRADNGGRSWYLRHNFSGRVNVSPSSVKNMIVDRRS